MAGCISEFDSNVLLCELSHCTVLIVSSEDAQMQPTAAKSYCFEPWNGPAFR